MATTAQLPPATQSFEPEAKQASDWLSIAMLASGGVLTVAWISFLLWAAMQGISWAVS